MDKALLDAEEVPDHCRYRPPILLAVFDEEVQNEIFARTYNVTIAERRLMHSESFSMLNATEKLAPNFPINFFFI